MTPDELALLLVPAAAVAAAVIATTVKKVAPVPLVVFEILLGLLLGPSVLGWVEPSVVTDTLADFGLAMLFFMAGDEIDFAAVRGRPLRRAGLGWLVSLVAGVSVGMLLAPDLSAGVIVGIALGSTALGTILPILRDSGDLHSPFGRAVTAVGAAGEFGPLVAISIFLSGRRPGTSTAVLLLFVVISAAAVWWASRGTKTSLHRHVTATLHTSGQLAVRLVLLLVAALVTLSTVLGLDMLLGAFAAGVLWQTLVAGAPAHDREHVEGKIEAVAFGFLVPVFFISTGITFELRALLDDPRALSLVPAFLVLMLLVRGLPGLLAAPEGSSPADRRAIVLLSATGLPIIVAVTAIGVDSGLLATTTAAALVGAGMLSVLIFPLVALAQRPSTPTPHDGAVHDAASPEAASPDRASPDGPAPGEPGAGRVEDDLSA